MMVTSETGGQVLADPERGGHAPSAGAAPGQLELVRTFVNTRDIEAGADELATPAGLDGWLRSNGLAGEPGAEVRAGSDDLRLAIALREALRAVLRAHVRGAHRAEPGSAAVTELRAIAARLPTRLAIADDGHPALAPAASGPAGGLTKILLIAAEAATAGTWQRLKVCSADACQWAFYDRSPTRSGCWCSMAVCGSRVKSRSYRKRAAQRR
jgi:predicted RNA-binding Zn ribbon-like protein